MDKPIGAAAISPDALWTIRGMAYNHIHPYTSK